MKYTYYGHSSFLIEAEGKKFLFDPFITQNPLAAAIDVKAIEADYIFISHGHGDHTGDLVLLAKQTGALVIAMAEVANWATQQGLTNVHAMNYGVATLDFGKVRMVWATHSSALPDGSNGGNPAGFVIELEGKTIYYAGDTSINMDMKLLAELYKVDYAILPVGGNYTMDADDALIAAKFVNTERIIGVHYNTMPEITIDKEVAIAKFSRENKQLILPAIGETIEL